MRKVYKLLLVFLLSLFLACDTNSDLASEVDNLINPSVLQLFAETDSEIADATFYIQRQSSFDAYNPTNNLSNLIFASTLKSDNIGNVFFNEIALNPTRNYFKDYGFSETSQELEDINSLFGKLVNFRNENCLNSDLCNFNFNFDMINKFVPQERVGFNFNTVTKSNGFTLKWDNSTINVDEIVGILIMEVNQNGKVGDNIPLFIKSIPSTSSEITISENDLTVFSENAIVNILLVKGNGSIYTLPNGKKIKVVGIDILYYPAILE